MNVRTLALSQEDRPVTQELVSKIAQKMGYSKSFLHNQLRINKWLGTNLTC